MNISKNKFTLHGLVSKAFLFTVDTYRNVCTMSRTDTWNVIFQLSWMLSIFKTITVLFMALVNNDTRGKNDKFGVKQ